MRRVIAAVLAVVASALFAAPAQAAAWWSTDRWGTWSSNGYTLYNNVWGSGYGPQTIWANSASNWGVWANHPNTGGIKSYPNATRYIGKKVSALGTTTSSFNVTVPTSGVAFTTAYDIWSSDNAHEIMLWMNKYGAVGPLGSLQTTTSSAGTPGRSTAARTAPTRSTRSCGPATPAPAPSTSGRSHSGSGPGAGSAT